MADNSSIWFNGGFVRSVNSGNTQRYPLGMSDSVNFEGLSDAWTLTKIYTAGTITHLADHVITNPFTIFGGATITFTLYLNGSPTALTLSWGPGEIGYKVNTTDSVHVVPGDEIWVRSTHNNVFEFAGTQNNLSVIFTPDDTAITVCKSMSDQYSAFVPIFAPTGDRYIALAGLHDNGSGTQEERQDCVPIDCTGKNICASAIFNSLNGNTVIHVQKNGIDTGVTVTIPAGSTAFAENTLGSVAFTAHDRVGFRWDFSASSSGAMNIANISMEFHSINHEFFLSAGQFLRTPSGASAAIAIGGGNYFLDPESSDQWSATLRGRTIGLCVNIRVNNATDDTHWRWRNGSVNGVTDVVIPAFQTGFFDAAGPDVWEVGDLLSTAEFTTSGGAITYTTVDAAFSFFFPPPPPECPGDTGAPRTDGLPYVPPPFDPCAGPGTTGAARTGM